MQIAIFGGAFNPLHLGHIKLAKAMVKENIVDHVLFIPSAISPHKHKKNITSFKHRLNMLKIAIDKNDKFSYSDLESKRKDVPSYTFETMEILSKKYSKDKLYLLIGSDNLGELHTWHKAKQLVNQYSLLIYPRESKIVTESYLEQFWGKELANKLINSIISLPLISFSSTNIRKLASEGKEIPNDLLDPKVKKYILEHRLYAPSYSKE